MGARTGCAGLLRGCPSTDACWRGEIIDGELYAFPRPAPAHAKLEAAVSGELDGPFALANDMAKHPRSSRRDARERASALPALDDRLELAERLRRVFPRREPSDDREVQLG